MKKVAGHDKSMESWGLGSCDFKGYKIYKQLTFILFTHQWQMKCYRRQDCVFDVFGITSVHPAFHVSQRCLIFRCFWSWDSMLLTSSDISALYLRFRWSENCLHFGAFWLPPAKKTPSFHSVNATLIWYQVLRLVSFGSQVLVGCYGDHWRVVAVFRIERMEFTHKSPGCPDAYRMLTCADWM